MNPRIIAVINQKGGVGKTTTSSNLCHALAMMGKKVTLIDLDPQGHLAVSLGVVESAKSGIDEVLLGHSEIETQLIPVRDNLQLIVSGPKLREIEQLTEGGVARGDLLRLSLQNHLKDQDFVFLDCPPSSGILAANALFAADELLIPMCSDFLSLQGLSHLVATVKRFEQVLKKKYKTLLVMSRYVSTRRLSKEVLDTLLKHFPGQVLATVIRETASLAECPGFGKTILEYQPKSPVAKDFAKLANNFIEGKVM
jgi:chromosome partitioning protein